MNQLLLAALIGLQALQSVATGAIQGRVSATGPKEDRANFVVTVEDIEGPFPPPEQTAVMEQRELRFVPHVLVILVGTTVEFPNRDPLSHNVFSISDAKRFNFGLYSQGTVRRLKFEKPGVVELLCHVHLEMSAFIVVVKNPYFARTDADGNYRISGVPPGRHRLRCWHERFPAQERTVLVPATGYVTVDFSVGR
jgi:plastocyanin